MSPANNASKRFFSWSATPPRAKHKRGGGAADNVSHEASADVSGRAVVRPFDHTRMTDGHEQLLKLLDPGHLGCQFNALCCVFAQE